MKEVKRCAVCKRTCEQKYCSKFCQKAEQEQTNWELQLAAMVTA